MNELTLLQKIAVWALPVIFAITVHEYAHGWVARRFGDTTAYMLGRLTLNPIKHIDPIGTLLVPGIMLMLGGFVFGWAKPVPVNWNNLRHPKRDMALVALAGPIANLIMAILWALVAKLGYTMFPTMSFIGEPLVYMGMAGVLINVILMILNLLPLPPLDGGRVLAGILPGPLSYKLSLIEPYGFIILIGLLVMGWLGAIIGPPIYAVQSVIFRFIGI